MRFMETLSLRGPRQTEAKNCAACDPVSRIDPAPMVLDNLFADGKPKAGAVRFAVGGKSFEQLVLDFGSDTGAAVLDLSDNLGSRRLDTNFDRPAIGHGVRGIMHQ